MMSKTLTAITYVCYATYKSISIKLFTSFTLNIVGKDGTDGENGTPGAKGDKGDKGEQGAKGKEPKLEQVLFTISTSKTVAPATGWNTTQPLWSSGNYLWKKRKITYTDNTVLETNPEVDSSWEAVNDIEIGGRNLLLNSSLDDISGWNNHTVTNDKYQFTNGYEGRGALEFLPGAASNCGIYTYPQFSNVELPIGTYTLSAWIYPITIGNSILGFNVTGYKFTTTSGLVLNKWQYKSITFDVTTQITKPPFYLVSSGFVGLISCVKLEKGNKATDYTPAPEDIQQDIDTSKEQLTTMFNSSIEQTKKEINLQVKSVLESVGANASAISSITNEIKLTNEATSFIKTTVDKLQDVVDGKVDEKTIQEWARFDGASLELGASNSVFKAILTNTELGFYQSGNKIAWISNNELHILKAAIEVSLSIGNFVLSFDSVLGFTIS